MLKIQLYTKTDPGKFRDNNEDNFCIQRRFKKETALQGATTYTSRFDTIAAVFDGIGGESYGEMAAFIAAKTTAHYNGHLPLGKWDMILEEINDRINEFAEHFGCSTGCTAAMLQYHEGYVNLCNLGDSRIYLFRNGELTQLSKDHTELQRALDMNLPDFDANNSGIKKGKLTKYLGIQTNILNPHLVNKYLVQPNDLFLLCSDGLTDMLTDEEIYSIITSSYHTGNELVESFIQRALENGGRDNVTVVVAQVVEKDTWWEKLKRKKHHK